MDYFHYTGRSKGLAWQKEVAYSLGLFIDYIAANDKLAKSKPITAQPSVPTVVVLFSNFARALTQGTISMDGIDPLGLYWEPKTILRASKLISNVTLFSDWAAEKLGTVPVNPWHNATYAERMVNIPTEVQRPDVQRSSHDRFSKILLGCVYFSFGLGPLRHT